MHPLGIGTKRSPETPRTKDSLRAAAPEEFPSPESRAARPVRFRFGPFELNSQTGELRRHGVRVRLPEQSCRVLVALIERHGELVSREELRRQIWTDGTFVDFDHGLNLAVNRLRHALGDAAAQPRYIETLPRKGYRFLVNAETVEERPPAQPAARRLPGVRWLLLAAVLLLAIVIVAFVFTARHVSKPPELLSAVPLTSYAGTQLCPSFAPDGERIVFSWNGEKQDNFDVYVKQIGVQTPLRLTTDSRPDLSPAWSPDGKTIAFVRLLANNRATVLLSAPVPGSPERQVAEVAAPREAYRNLRFLAWSPDGKWLVVADARSTDSNFGLSLVSVETGEKRTATQPQAGYNDFDPAFSPDMRRLAFIRHTGSEAADIHVLELAAGLRPRGQPRRVTFDHRRTSSPAWTRDGKALIVTRYSLSSGPGLWKITPSTPPRLEPLPIAAHDAFALAIPPKGGRLVYTRETTHTHIWAVERFRSQSGDNAAPPRMLVNSSRRDFNPTFSPDGRQIAFQSDRSGWIEIWIADADGSHPRQMTNLRSAVAGFPRWSPDGRKIVFQARPQSYARLFLLDVATGQARPLNYEPVNDPMPSWSRDGKWIYFVRIVQDAQIWKVAAGGGPAIQLTKNGGYGPLESADGKFVFYSKLNNGLWRMPVSDAPGTIGEEEQVLPDSVAGMGAAYAPVRDGIYFIRLASERAKQNLAFFSFATRRTTTIAEIPGAVLFTVTVSPDERTILYGQDDHMMSDLMLVENFR